MEGKTDLNAKLKKMLGDKVKTHMEAIEENNQDTKARKRAIKNLLLTLDELGDPSEK